MHSPIDSNKKGSAKRMHSPIDSNKKGSEKIKLKLNPIEIKVKKDNL